MTEPTQEPDERSQSGPRQPSWLRHDWTPGEPAAAEPPNAYPPPPATWSAPPPPPAPAPYAPPAALIPPAPVVPVAPPPPSWRPLVSGPAARPEHGRESLTARLLALGIALVIVFAVGFAVGGSSGTAVPTSPPRVTSAPGITAPPAVTAAPGATDQPTPTDVAAGPTPNSAPGATVPPNVPSDFGVFWQALKLVQDNFVDATKVTDQNLTWGAIRGMVDALGDIGHSDFLTPADLKADNDSLNGHVSGIGVVVDTRNVPPTIITVIPNSPASGAGLRPGDVILAVDGTNTETMQPSEIVTHIRGQAGTSVTLSIRHTGDSNSVDITIVRADVTVPASTWGMIPGTKIADIHVQQFSAGAAAATKANIQAALTAGAQKIVLDLRGNPGGYVNEAITVASQFLPEGDTVYQEKDRAGNVVPNKTEAGGLAVNVSLVVLIDQGSASAAEIVAGSMQGNQRAKLIGETTFGTGTVLNTFTLSDGSAIRLGVREWLTPTGATIFGKGITPDVVVALPANGAALDAAQLQPMSAADFAASTDTQLQQAVQLLTTP